MKNNLMGILNQTFPSVNFYFDSSARADGNQKQVDFATTYWHMDCVRRMFPNALADDYHKQCKGKKYNFISSKAEKIYLVTKELFPVLPKDDLTKLTIQQSVEQLNTASRTVEELQTSMNETAAKLP